MKKRITITLLIVLSSISSYAQFYTIASGIKESTSTNIGKTYEDKSSLLLENKKVCLQSAMVDSLYSIDSMSTRIITKELTDIINEYSRVSLPLRHIHVTSPFGIRLHPIDKIRKLHNGIDLSARREDVFAMFDGVIKSIGHNKASGNYVSLQHGDDITISYCHLEKVIVNVGDCVEAGEVVAVSGNTGKSTNYHLHVTARKKGKYINPDALLSYIKEIKHHSIHRYALLRKRGFAPSDIVY